MSYYDLSIPWSSLLICLAFLELCVAGYCLVAVWQNKKPLRKVLLSACVLGSGFLLIVYSAEARSRLYDLELPSISRWFAELALWLPLSVILLILIYLLWVLTDEVRYHRNTITRTSIQEGINKLTSGLCFYQDGGRITLVNHRMMELCHEIVGRDLQNAVLFWEILSSGQPREGVVRLSQGSCPSFRLPDGKVWTFVYENLGGIHQLTAAETTQIQAVTDELKEKNLQLAALNARLRLYGESVDELTRSKERLEIKARIHSELGQALLSTRRYLVDENSQQKPPLEMWQRNIAMLRKEAQIKEDEQPMEMLSRIADSTGIEIERRGELPADMEVQKLFVRAAAEALTNAVSHAHAKKLFIELQENEHTYTVCFRNDGDLPAGEIIEGGGLGSLRKKIKQEGGTMEVAALPEFVLTVRIPKQRGELL